MSDDAPITADDVARAIDAGELFLEYLPVMHLDGPRTCIGAEALVRWQRGDEVVPPLDFVPVVEQTPVSGTLTYWVMDRVAEELLDFLIATPAAHISVNVPPEVFGRGALRYAAEKSQLARVRRQLVAEITERGVLDNLGLAELKDMAERRVRLALDDVGIPDGNVVALARTPIDMIKLDRNLVGTLDRPSGDAVRRSLEALVSTTDIIVIAEGVERETQLTALRDAGVHFGQGWLFSHPLRAKDYIEFFRAHSEAP